MSNTKTNTVDPKTGTTTYQGPSQITKGNHNYMPSRTSAYLPTDERGHIQASSLGGSNSRNNVAPMSKDLNHGSYLHMENAEKSAIQNGATVQSEKTAFVSNQPGGRPDAFMVNDTITFSNGNTQTVNLSFSNMQNDQQAAINDEVSTQASSLMDEFSNPGDVGRASMTTEEYAELMEQTDASLPNIADYYSEWDYSGTPAAAAETATATADWDGVTAGDPVGTESAGTDDAAPDSSDGGVSASDDED